jgi:hypothetical protein
MVLICDQFASTFDNLEFEWPRQMKTPYRTRPGAPTEQRGHQGSGPSPPFASAPSIAGVAPRHEAMNGLGFGTSPSKAATVQTVPF